MTKILKLRKILNDLKSVVVAYSGGLDSTYLLKVAIDTLGRENVLAVTARSETYPYSEYKEAVRLAKKIGARQMTIKTSEFGIKRFRDNPVNRCYYCKKELFRTLLAIAKKKGLKAVIDGANHDDLKDVRHGMAASRELGVKSPLLESRIGKDFIRKHSKALGLETWQKPSLACLASRIPFYERIDGPSLKRVAAAEDYLRRQGFKQVRVRLHKDIARLEFFDEDMDRLLARRLRNAIAKKLKSLGFKYITLDLEGYRTGSMHEVL